MEGGSTLTRAPSIRDRHIEAGAGLVRSHVEPIIRSSLRSLQPQQPPLPRVSHPYFFGDFLRSGALWIGTGGYRVYSGLSWSVSVVRPTINLMSRLIERAEDELTRNTETISVPADAERFIVTRAIEMLGERDEDGRFVFGRTIEPSLRNIVFAAFVDEADRLGISASLVTPGRMPSRVPGTSGRSMRR